MSRTGRVERTTGETKVLVEVRRICAEHPGPVSVFLHVLLPEQEVIIRAPRAAVDGGAVLQAKLESLLGPGAILFDHARRA